MSNTIKIKNIILKNPIIISPLLMIVLFIMNIYKLIPNEYFSITDFICSLLFLIVVTYIIFIGNCFVYKEKNKAEIFTTFILVFILYYTDIEQLLYKSTILLSIRSILSVPIILMVFSPLLIILFLYLYKTSRKLTSFNVYLNYLLGALILFNVFLLFSNNKKTEVTLKNELVIGNVEKQETYPDIYYIILDSYTSSESLRRFWNFNNSDFNNYLKNRGFYVAYNSKSSYKSTPLSIAASLNMSQISYSIVNDNIEEAIGGLNKLIKDSKVVNFLSKQGYVMVNFSLYDLGKEKKYYYMKGYFNENSFLSRTLFDIMLKKSKGNINQSNLEIFNQLIKESKIKHTKPIFVYAHLMMPHYPYFFDRNGNLMSQNYSGAYSIVLNILSDKEKYLSQLIYTNKLVSQAIDSIQKNSRSKPLIIIQGDHGFRYLENEGKNIESYTILNSYYFPDQDYKRLNDSINPINSFRVVLNKYFNTNLQIINN